MTRIALDSNVLAYLAGVSRSGEDEPKITEARSLIRRLADHVSLIAPAQAMGKLFVVLRRSGASADEARSILIEFVDAFGTSASASSSILAAADLVVDHKLQFWDSLILTAAKCGLLAAFVGRYAKWIRHPRRDHCESFCRASPSEARRRFKQDRRTIIRLVELRGIEPLTSAVRLPRNATFLSVLRHFLAEKFLL